MHREINSLKQKLRRGKGSKLSINEQENLRSQIKDLEDQIEQRVQPTNKLTKWRRVSSSQHATYEDAFREGVGRRPGFEFGAERGVHKNRSDESKYLLCRGPECVVQRKIGRVGELFVVYESDDQHHHTPVF